MPMDPYAALQALLRAEATRAKSDPPEKTESLQNPHHSAPEERPRHLDPEED
ncbi:hypothetical protein [Streptomyces formicae]|uniref:Uncharacterized protein n=1 Tax=Streptomyces formicae TaxID=1616117 RepID=A0A291QBS0_9ACTN|nr:hypothetical protein [Streptomyces formicae]ATL28937.1 hypothetical protein KY5_3919 [Streptomyces formicae]